MFVNSFKGEYEVKRKPKSIVFLYKAQTEYCASSDAYSGRLAQPNPFNLGSYRSISQITHFAN